MERLKAQVLERTERAVRRFVKAADAYALRYDFAGALAEYEKAARWAKRDVAPALWAEVQNLLGIAHWQLGIRVEGESSRVHLAQAVLAYRSALEVYTKKDLPHHWAATQNNLGNAFRGQASRTQGPEGTARLAQAVVAYRSALEVQTKKDLPQDWATTQNNLGLALRDQAQRLPPDSPARKELLTQAVGVFRAALEIHTQTVFPLDWARAQRNLAQACALLSDDRCAADSFANVLHVYPDWTEGYGDAYVRYHERLFLFAEAYALNRAWLARHPDDLAVWTNYIESHLTTGRLAEVSALLAKVFAKLSPAEQVPLLAIEFFALVGQGKPAEAASKRKALRMLIDAQPADFRVSWTFGGTRHFLQTDPCFSPHKAQLLALLSALEQPSRAAILSALDARCQAAPQHPQPQHQPFFSLVSSASWARCSTSPASAAETSRAVPPATLSHATAHCGAAASQRCPAESPSVSTAEPAPQPHAPEAPTNRPSEPPRQRAARPSPATYAVPKLRSNHGQSDEHSATHGPWTAPRLFAGAWPSALSASGAGVLGIPDSGSSPGSGSLR